MLEVTAKKLSAVEEMLRSQLDDSESDKAQDQVAKAVINSQLMNVAEGALKALSEDRHGPVAVTQGSDIMSTFVYCMAIGIRVGIALAEADQLETALKG